MAASPRPIFACRHERASNTFSARVGFHVEFGETPVCSFFCDDVEFLVVFIDDRPTQRVTFVVLGDKNTTVLLGMLPENSEVVLCNGIIDSSVGFELSLILL